MFEGAVEHETFAVLLDELAAWLTSERCQVRLALLSSCYWRRKAIHSSSTLQPGKAFMADIGGVTNQNPQQGV